MKTGGIILAGGHSRRMGAAKADLQFGNETMLAHTVRIVERAGLRVIVVAAPNQRLPPLSANVRVVRDRQPDRGPLEAIAAGLHAWREIDPAVEAVWICACDTPLLKPEFIRRMIEMLDAESDAATPIVDGMPHPLAGAYRVKILPAVERMLAANQLRLVDLLAQIKTQFVAREELFDVDPELQSLRNVNTPEEYQAALAAAGLAGENRM
ncbi:MAG TPA: molybdenum cofactor guanylyltransferase [Pirellulales bacterium]|jgi:molybdopterin-guanine dinucleotide biosynthesis protein A